MIVFVNLERGIFFDSRLCGGDGGAVYALGVVDLGRLDARYEEVVGERHVGRVGGGRGGGHCGCESGKDAAHRNGGLASNGYKERRTGGGERSGCAQRESAKDREREASGECGGQVMYGHRLCSCMGVLRQMGARELALCDRDGGGCVSSGPALSRQDGAAYRLSRQASTGGAGRACSKGGQRQRQRQGAEAASGVVLV